MPLPKPRKGEDKTGFISRCMGSKPAQEFSDTGQRYAVCLSQWNRRKKHINPVTGIEEILEEPEEGENDGSSSRLAG